MLICKKKVKRSKKKKKKTLNEVHDFAGKSLVPSPPHPHPNAPANKCNNYCTSHNNGRFICPHKDTQFREHNTDNIDAHTVVKAGTHLCPSRAFRCTDTILSHFNMSHEPWDGQGCVINNWLRLRSF